MCQETTTQPFSSPALSDAMASSREILQKGTRLGSTSLGLLFVAYSLTMPHLQSRRDALGCDSLCLGSMTSARSALKLLGATVMGRASDNVWVYRNQSYSARRICLWIGFAAAAIALVAANRAASLPALWWSLLPEALEQNMHIFRALLGEYQASNDITAAERAASAGSLGAAMGLAMMVGPLLGSIVSYEQATGLALVMLAAAASLVTLLPMPEQQPAPSPPPLIPTSTRRLRSLVSFVDVPSARSPPALFLLVCRLLSTIAFHIYQTMLNISLRDRFAFGPSEYGRFFSCIGLFFALSQGVLAKWLLQQFGSSTPRHRVRLVVVCSLLITLTRYFGYVTSNIAAVYAIFAIMVTAYGVMATIFAADTTQIAAPNELGSFFGLVAAVESGAGMAGPLLGGALNSAFSSKGGDGITTSSPPALWAVMFLNLLVTVLLAMGYERIVLLKSVVVDSKTKQE